MVDEPGSTQHSILLVEDEAIVALSEARTLERHGFDVVVAHSGEHAISLALSGRSPDLILMDIDLGSGVDGTETAERILSEITLPIVFLTSHTEKEYVDRVRGITNFGYVIKDSGEFVLIESVRMALQLFDAQQQARESEAEYQRILHSSEEAIVSYDTDGKVLVVNATAAAYLGGAPQDFVGRPLCELLNDGSAERGLESIRRVVTTGETVRRESAVELGGHTRWFDMRFQPIRGDSNRHVSAVLQISREISERKQVEDALRASEEKYRLLAENTVDVIYSLAPDLTPTYISPSVQTLLGYSPEHITRCGIFGFVDPEDLEEVRDKLMASIVARTERSVAEFRVVTATGARRWIENQSRFLYDKHGDLQVIVGTQRDIDARKRAQQQLQAALEQKEHLMRELNHRVKNNLWTVISLVRLKQDTLGDVVDLSDIVSQIMAIRFVHEKLQESGDSSRVDLAPYVEAVLSSLFSAGADADVHVDSFIPEVSLPTKVATTVGLIVNELATNAAKHGFASYSEKRFTVRFETDEDAGRHVLTVSNRGRAFPDDVDIEQPDTLGLQLVNALTQQLGGTLHLQRNPHPVFTLRFPVPA